MAKKKKIVSSAPVPLTRGQISRAEREKRRIRSLYTAGFSLATLIVLILGFAVITEAVLRPNEEVAKVGDKVINRATYNKLRRWNLYNTLQQQALQEQFSQQQGSTAGSQTLQLQSQLQNVENETQLDSETVLKLKDDEWLRQASFRDFQITPSEQELKDAAVKNFVPQPTPPATPEPTTALSSPTITGTTTITPTATRTPTAGPPTSTPTVTPTLPPVPGGQETAVATYNRYVKAWDESTVPQQEPICRLGCPDISEADYLALLIDPLVRKDKVIEKLTATNVITEVEQIRAQHILTDTEEGAKKLLDLVQKGADFTKTANEQSSEQIRNIQNGTAPNGGDLGWFPREGSNLVTAFVEGAWPVQVGEVSQPVNTSFGWHLIKVLERDPARALEPAQVESRKTKLYDDWFTKAKESIPASDKLPPAVVGPTPPPVVEPTPPALPTATPGGAGTAVPGATPTSGSAGVTPTADSTQPSPAGATPSP